jgi:hypothetical protein
VAWHDSLKNNWSTIVTFGCIVVAAFVEAWQEATSSLPAQSKIPRLEGGWHYVPLFLLIAAGIVWLFGHRKPVVTASPQSQAIQPSGPVIPGIPTLSALLGQNPQITFDAKTFFAHAYYSPVTAEFETNIKTIARQYSPNDTESFYARFIGIGAVAYQHDVTWFTIYKSQMSALVELNARGMIPLADVKKHYDKAVIAYPKTYLNYSFDQWMNYMQSRLLVIKHPSNMAEITHGGKDFLRYVAHKGWNANLRAN